MTLTWLKDLKGKTIKITNVVDTDSYLQIYFIHNEKKYKISAFSDGDCHQDNWLENKEQHDKVFGDIK